MEPKVTVVVLNWNRPQDTIACVESLKAQDYPRLEILLVDNGSSYDSVAILRKRCPGLTLLENNRNLGYAEGNNAGIRWALAHGADFILILNNDAVADKTLVKDLVDAAARYPEAGILGPKIYSYEEPDRLLFTTSRIDWRNGESIHEGLGQADHGRFCDVVKTDRLCGCAMLMRREVFEKVGLLDPDYFLYYEDVDFCVRAGGAGYKSLCVGTAKVWHKVSSSTQAAQGSALHAYYDVRNRLLFLKKHTRPWGYALGNFKEFCWAYLRHRIRHPFDRRYLKSNAPRFWATLHAMRDFHDGKVGIQPKYHEAFVP